MCHLVGNSSSIDISILSSMLIFSIEKEIRLLHRYWTNTAMIMLQCGPRPATQGYGATCGSLTSPLWGRLSFLLKKIKCFLICKK